MDNNRVELFIKYWLAQLTITDCDPHLNMMRYIFDRMEFNIEQRYWLCWLFANTYQLPSAYVIWNEFPDYENVDQERLDYWTTNYFHKLPYQVDQKWNKGHLGTMFKSYRECVGSSQEDYFASFLSNSKTIYEEAWDKASRFHKFGRYTIWFYLQTLNDCVNLGWLYPTNLLLGDSASQSHRDGLYYVLGMDDQVSCPVDQTIIPSLEENARQILMKAIELRPDLKPDFFNMETALCSFKKLFRARDSRYIGYYLDRQCIDIQNTESKDWVGIDWNLLWDYRKEILDQRFVSNKGIDKSKFGSLVKGSCLPGFENEIPGLDLFPNIGYENN